jgi:hypothetical protein
MQGYSRAPFAGRETFHPSLHRCINELLLDGGGFFLIEMGRNEGKDGVNVLEIPG